MVWRLRQENDIKYFLCKNQKVSALYSTKHGGEELIRRLQPVFLTQIHSEVIVNIDNEHELTGDGIITEQRHSVIGVKVADCLPVYIFSSTKFCVLHCGWRSIIKGIAKKARKLMGDYQYVLGASIGPCCYEIKKDVAQIFKNAYQQAVIIRDHRYFLDLKKAVTQDLGEARLLGSLDYCTRCHPEYFYSFRLGDLRKRNYAILAVQQ